MPAILDLPEVRARVSLMSVETYEMLAEMGSISKRAELIRGVVIDKMPKSPLHRDLTKAIYEFLLAWQASGFVVFMEAALRLKDSKPEPDVMLVHGTASDYAGKDPTTAALVVEVAVSSAALDRQNASLYAEAGVTEYWIVLAPERRIEVYRQPENGAYRQTRTYAVDETLLCESVPGLEATLAGWFD